MWGMLCDTVPKVSRKPTGPAPSIGAPPRWTRQLMGKEVEPARACHANALAEFVQPRGQSKQAKPHPINAGSAQRAISPLIFACTVRVSFSQGLRLLFRPFCLLCIRIRIHSAFPILTTNCVTDGQGQDAARHCNCTARRTVWVVVRPGFVLVGVTRVTVWYTVTAGFVTD